jgi:hypothetical protein
LTESCFKAANFSQTKTNGKILPAISLRLKRRLLYGKRQAITRKVNLHLYHYAGNNPLKYTDPDGNTPKLASFENAFNLDFGKDYMQLAGDNFNEGEYGWAAVMAVDAISEAAYDMLAAYAGASIIGGAATAGIGTIASTSVNAVKGVLSSIGNKISSFFAGIAQRTTETPIQFGGNQNQVYHAFRHTKEAGLNSESVSQAILNDLKTAGSTLTEGEQLIRKIKVNGMELTYTAFKTVKGFINVGRIVVGND